MALNSAIHLRQTQAFINERPAQIVISRRTKTPTENGGYKLGTPVDLAPQTMRKVGSKEALPITTSDGRLLVPTHNVIAMPDADIEVNDKFTLDGVVHEVLVISTLPEWRIQAGVIEYG